MFGVYLNLTWSKNEMAPIWHIKHVWGIFKLNMVKESSQVSLMIYVFKHTPFYHNIYSDVSHWLGRRTKHHFIRVWKPSPNKRILSLEGKLERESPKRKISTSGESGALQMVLDLDIGAIPRRG